MHATIEQLDIQAKELLAKLGDNNLSMKERLTIPLQDMPTQDPMQRITNMEEVALGYTENQVKVEAMRCLQCKNKPCIQGCPVGIDIPAFILQAAKGDFAGANATIKESSLLPSICGRVCPQENQCQEYCTYGKIKKDISQSVAIGRIERYVADYAREHNQDVTPFVKKSTRKKVAIVGSGPASVSAAADVRREGHTVVMYEALHKAGGVLVYGIPEFRLPKKLVQRELDGLASMGVEINKNFLVGKTRTLEDLKDKDGFDAIFIGAGAGLPKFLNIPGENLIGVFSANEYLTRSNLMKAYDQKHSLTPLFPSEKVAVFGGGNVAMDSARTAKRLGAKEVTIIYRRSEDELPARKEEVEHAKEEGINFLLLHQPHEIIANEKGSVKGVKVVTCKLGEPDASGRRRPIEIEGTEQVIDFDTVVVSIGNASNPLLKQTTKGLDVNKRGNIIINEETCETSIKGVYAGGDIVLGAATVILAMGQGRKAAKSINAYLNNN